MLKKISTHLSQNVYLYSILLIGLILRLVYMWEYSLLPDWSQLTVDNNFHHHWALSIIEGNYFGDTTYFRAPFYIYYLAAIYKLFGTSLWAVRLFGIIPGLLSIAITYFTAQKILNKQCAIVAGLLHAIYPLIYYFESELLLDSLFMLLLQIGIYFFIKWWKDDTLKDIFYAGIFLGLASITRPTALVIAALILVTIILIKKMTLKSLILFSIGLVICIVPIFVRNIVIADDPVLIASQGGINLYVGNNDAADGISAVLPEPLGSNWHIQQVNYLAEKESGKKLSPGDISSFWTSKAIDWILAHPSQFLNLYFQKVYHNISNREISNNRYLQNFFDRIKLLKYNFISFGVLFTLAFLTTIFNGTKNKQLLFLAILIGLYICVTSLFFFSSRFRLPMLPFYIILAAQTLVGIKILLSENKKTAFKVIGLAVIIGMVSFYPIVPLPSGSQSHYYTSKGIYYSATGSPENALTYFKLANELNKDYPENNLNIGATYLKMGQADSAQYYIFREKELHPLQSKGYTNSASLYYSQMKYDSAYIDIKKSIELEPYNIIANQLYIKILFALHLSVFDLQKELLELRRRTDDNIYLLNEAALYIYNDSTINNSYAISVLNDAVNTTPPPIETDDASFGYDSPNKLSSWNLQKAKSYYHLSYIYGISKQYNKAIDASNKSIELDPTFADAYVNLISGYFSVGKIDEGKELLQTALQKFPTHERLLKIQQLIQ